MFKHTNVYKIMLWSTIPLNRLKTTIISIIIILRLLSTHSNSESRTLPLSNQLLGRFILLMHVFLPSSAVVQPFSFCSHLDTSVWVHLTSLLLSVGFTAFHHLNWVIVQCSLFVYSTRTPPTHTHPTLFESNQPH